MTDCLFCRIAEKEIPATICYEDDEFIAFADISPAAPSHTLIIPKRHLDSINVATDADEAFLGRLMLTAQKVARRAGLQDDGYRLVVNTGKAGGQTVQHLHVHLLGGRDMQWPPG